MNSVILAFNTTLVFSHPHIAYSNSSFGSSTRMALLGRIEGLTCANDLIAHLTKIMDDHQGVLVAERADR